MSTSMVSDLPYKIALVCAEPSGDMLASGLVHTLLARFPNAQIKGIGGDLTQTNGLESWFDMNELSVMGLVEVLKHLPRLLSIRKQLKAKLLAFQPDIYIGVDAPDFNLPIETFLKKHKIKTVHYVSPTIWAWRESRVHKIKRAVDCVMGLFPFEAPVFAKYDVPYQFVGHPMADAIALQPDQHLARTNLCLNASANVLALLPGSRSSEVMHLLPIFLDSFALLQASHPDLVGVVPAVNAAREEQIKQLLETYPTALQSAIMVTRRPARDVMIASDAVLLSSGTATLEAMLCKRPMLSVYKMSGLTYKMMQYLYKPDYFSLPNILANEPLVPELLQDDVTPEAISAYINDLFALDLPPTQRVTDESSTPLVTQSNITRLPVHSKGSCLFAIDQARLEYIMLRFTQLHLTLQQNADEQSADVVTRYLRQ
jgi:lipid-A-disaccharide synthase